MYEFLPPSPTPSPSPSPSPWAFGSSKYWWSMSLSPKINNKNEILTCTKDNCIPHFVSELNGYVVLYMNRHTQHSHVRNEWHLWLIGGMDIFSIPILSWNAWRGEDPGEMPPHEEQLWFKCQKVEPSDGTNMDLTLPLSGPKILTLILPTLQKENQWRMLREFLI